MQTHVVINFSARDIANIIERAMQSSNFPTTLGIATTTLALASVYFAGQDFSAMQEAKQKIEKNVEQTHRTGLLMKSALALSAIATAAGLAGKIPLLLQGGITSISVLAAGLIFRQGYNDGADLTPYAYLKNRNKK